MEKQVRFEKLVRTLLFELEPLLPGSVSEQYNVCGKPGCRCKDKVNPQKHGPYHQVSFTLGGKSSTLAVKREDLADARAMTEAHRRMRLLLRKLAEESVVLCRQAGVSAARRQMREAIASVRSALSSPNGKTPHPGSLLCSRDGWKAKALEHQSLLEKNRVKIRDLEKSREKWRTEALAFRQKINNLRQSVINAEQEKSDLSARLGVTEQELKKNE